MALAIKQIETLLDQYEVFLVDAWGVLHDGHTLYPGAKATLELLKAADKRCLILSNAISRRDQFKSHLDELGLAPNLYNDVVTSGELCWQALKQGNNAMLNALGDSSATSITGMRCFHLGASNRRGYTDGLDLEMVSDIDDAQFILNTALGKVEQLGDYSAVLDKAKKLGLPMVCPNPDVTAIKGGLPIMTAGAVGQLFEKMGGQVVYLGKPYQAVYDRCFSLFPSVDRTNFVALGDGLPTDIKGANNTGIDSILLVSGIHQTELAEESQETVFKRYDTRPTYILNTLQG